MEGAWDDDNNASNGRDIIFVLYLDYNYPTMLEYRQ